MTAMLGDACTQSRPRRAPGARRYLGRGHGLDLTARSDTMLRAVRSRSAGISPKRSTRPPRNGKSAGERRGTTRCGRKVSRSVGIESNRATNWGKR
jgi:hypothetical protein